MDHFKQTIKRGAIKFIQTNINYKRTNCIKITFGSYIMCFISTKGNENYFIIWNERSHFDCKSSCHVIQIIYSVFWPGNNKEKGEMMWFCNTDKRVKEHTYYWYTRTKHDMPLKYWYKKVIWVFVWLQQKGCV